MDTAMLLEGGLGVAATAAIVSALKSLGVRTKWLPLASLVIGMALSVAYGLSQGYNAATIIVYGFLFAGVAAHGYDIQKAAVENISPTTEIASLERRLVHLKKQTTGQDDAGA